MKLHYETLKPKKKLKCTPSSNFYTFDIETRDGLKGSSFFSASLSSSDKRAELFTSLEELTYYILSRKKNMKIYVHNLDFDLRFLAQICIENDNLYYNRFGNSKTICFIVNHKINDKKTIQLKFIDSLQFLFKSQEICEKIFNVDKELTKIDCSDLFNIKFKFWSNKDKDKVKEHNKNDTKALWQIMKKLRTIVYETFGINFNNYISISSLALDCWRTTLKEDILNPFLTSTCEKNEEKQFFFNEHKYRYIRNSYFGGRNEFIRNKKDTEEMFYYNDYHSHYPAQMLKFFPSGRIHHVLFTEDYETNIQIFKQTSKNYFGIYHINIINESTETIQLLHAKTNRLIFPIGKWSGYYTNIEIEKALQLGYKISFNSGYFFEHKVKIFKKFITKLYKIKETSEKTNPSLYLFSKICMNSLYGKFAQKREMKQKRYETFDSYNEGIKRFNEILLLHPEAYFKTIDSKAIISYDEIEICQKVYQLPHLSSFTTSYGRIQLFEDLELAKFENVLYMDTDSLLTNQQGYNNLKNRFNDKIGYLGVEWKSNNVYIFTEKAYMYYDLELNKIVLKVKGLNRYYINSELEKIKEIPSFEQIRTIVEKDLKKGFKGFKKYNNVRSSLIRHGNCLSYNEVLKKFTLLRNKRKFISDTKSEVFKIDKL